MITGQLVDSVTMNFTLHTEPNASVPEFTISCRTHGGPATTVQWTVNGYRVQEDRYRETSQLILDTSLDSVYDNRLRVRGRRSGTYNCIVSNNIRDYLPRVSVTEVPGSLTVSGKDQHIHFLYNTFPVFTQLLKCPPVLLQSSQSPTVHMWISLCLGSHQVILSLTMSSTTSLREDQSSVTGSVCVEELLSWMVFREESPTTSH